MRKVVLLRGINVGGNKKVPMADLRKLFEKNGFRNVKTLLASGNVVLDDPENKVSQAGKIIEEHFGFTVPSMFFPFSDIVSISEENPFSEITVNEKIRLYVTFLPKDAEHYDPEKHLYKKEGYEIIGGNGRFIYSVLNLEIMGSVDAMSILEKTHGKGITTRNFNTLKKIAALS
jgi:uncharacterized protein (DUF1697 family)